MENKNLNSCKQDRRQTKKARENKMPFSAIFITLQNLGSTQKMLCIFRPALHNMKPCRFSHVGGDQDSVTLSGFRHTESEVTSNVYQLNKRKRTLLYKKVSHRTRRGLEFRHLASRAIQHFPQKFLNGWQDVAKNSKLKYAYEDRTAT